MNLLYRANIWKAITNPYISLLLLVVISGCTSIPPFNDSYGSPVTVPADDPNRLLLKEGTQYTCGNYHVFDVSAYVNNWWNKEGTILNGCEMLPNSEMLFIFKQHDQSIRTHTGEINIKIRLYAVSDGADVEVYYMDKRGTWFSSGNYADIPKGIYDIETYGDGTEIEFLRFRVHDSSRSNVLVDRVEVRRAL